MDTQPQNSMRRVIEKSGVFNSGIIGRVSASLLSFLAAHALAFGLGKKKKATMKRRN